MIDAKDTPSTRPYLIRALYEWCTDHGFTPYIAVLVDEGVRVPNEYVKNGEIVLNVSFDATSALKMGNEYIEFKGRFGGVARDILVPVDHVLAIYARENGQGMAFPMLATPSASASASSSSSVPASRHPAPVAVQDAPDDEPPRPGHGGSGGSARPTLTRIK